MGQTYACMVKTELEGAFLAAVTGGSRAGELAETYDVEATPDVESLLARDDVDIVCIATPHAVHGPQGLLAAEAGKHLLIDKPMATTTAQCDAILAACVSKGLRCEITFTQRERVCNIETKRLLDAGALGALQTMHNVQTVPNGMASVPRWQLAPENVGILMGHGIHNIDQVRWFTGQEVAKVFAKLRTFSPDHSVDATADLMLTLTDGTVCTIFCSFELPAPGFPRSGGATRIACARGLIDADWYGELRVSRDGGAFEVAATQEKIDWQGKGFLDPVRLKTYARIMQRLVDGVRHGHTRSASAWDGRQAVAIAEAAYRSSATGQEVALPVEQPPRY